MATQSEELTIPEIYQKYPKRWVAIIVTQRDRNMQPLKGRVVADDVDRYRLRRNVVKLNEVCFFYAGESDFPLLL
jgi:hypothetical protein